MERKHPLIAAWCFLSLMLVAAVVTALTFYHTRDALFVPHTGQELLVGKAAAAFEDAYEDGLVVRDYAVHLWGAIKYAAFKTGNDGVVIGKEAWYFTDEEYKTVADAAKEEAAKLEKIAQVREYLASHGIELMVALLPAKSRLYEEMTRHPHPSYREDLYPRFREALLARGVVTPDLYRSFKEAKSSTQLFMRTDTHWTPQGAFITAQALADEFSRACSGLMLTPSSFVTEEDKAASHEGDLLRFIPTGSFKHWVGPHAEDYTPLRTKAASDAEADASALFGGQDIPVALVGTSYSQQEEWNFEGSLKTALSVDVVNTASEGKGPLDPMAKFLKETDLSSSSLKLVIWEIPERFIPVAYPDVVFPELKHGDENANACATEGVAP